MLLLTASKRGIYLTVKQDKATQSFALNTAAKEYLNKNHIEANGSSAKVDTQRVPLPSWHITC